MNQPSDNNWPLIGCGVGLRHEHFEYILEHQPEIDWFEAVSENFMESGGRPLDTLCRVRKRYPVVLHGVSMSIGSVDPVNEDYLFKLKRLADRIEPVFISDHLCWASVNQHNLHDLLPLPFTPEALKHITERVLHVQEYLGRRILLENVSSYIAFEHSVIPEWEFLEQTAIRSGCGILLDINNIYVNAFNHKFDAYRFIDFISPELVGYMHLAGHTNMGNWLFDTHSKKIIEPVWELYEYALKRFGKKNTLVEWDADIPDFQILEAEQKHAKKIYLNAPDLPEASPRKTASFIAGAVSTGDKVSLAEVQHWIQSRAFSNENTAGSSGGSVRLSASGSQSPEDGLRVYQGGYGTRVYEALKEVYIAVEHVVGHDYFMNLSLEFAKAYPSTQFNLGQVGMCFDYFLKQHPVSGKLPFVSDLATLEWQINSAFHAFKADGLKPEDLQTVDPEQFGRLSFGFQQWVSVMASAWPVFEVWKARTTPVKEIDIQIADNPQNVLVYRNDLQVVCETISLPQYRVLKSLLEGVALEEALDDAGSGADEEIPVMSWFQHWMQIGLFKNIHIKKSSIRS